LADFVRSVQPGVADAVAFDGGEPRVGAGPDEGVLADTPAAQ
jgi:hypothetical protein